MTRYVIDAAAAIQLVSDGAAIAPAHTLLAPTLLRSDALALAYEAVRQGRTDERSAKRSLDGIRGLRIRLLGDRVLQSAAWDIARRLDWPDTYRAEYIALTRLHADALVSADPEFAAAAATVVAVAPLADLFAAG